MKLEKILLPTDFSALGYEGLRTAGLLADQAGAELLIVHVMDPSIIGRGDPLSGTDSTRAFVEKQLLETMPSRENLNVTHSLLEGDAAEEIVRFARHEHVDLIVMGSHGRSGLPRALMGSVANDVLHHAPCAVLTVRPRVRVQGKVKAWAHRKHQPLVPRSSTSP